MNQEPLPIHTAAVELTDWTLGRTADFPKCHRHTFGQRLDNLCLDALEHITRARFARDLSTRKNELAALNLKLELMRVFWRLVEGRGWIGGRQCLHAARLVDEVGRMAGAWMKKTGD